MNSISLSSRNEERAGVRSRNQIQETRADTQSNRTPHPDLLPRLAGRRRRIRVAEKTRHQQDEIHLPLLSKGGEGRGEEQKSNSGNPCRHTNESHPSSRPSSPFS